MKPDDEGNEEAPREITSMLIKFRNPMGMMLARGINSNSKLQAALPNIEINRLFSLLGVGVDTLRGLAIVIMLISGISVFVSLYNSLKERRYEMALMLSMGASRMQLFGMLLLEGLSTGPDWFWTGYPVQSRWTLVVLRQCFRGLSLQPGGIWDTARRMGITRCCPADWPAGRCPTRAGCLPDEHFPNPGGGLESRPQAVYTSFRYLLYFISAPHFMTL